MNGKKLIRNSTAEFLIFTGQAGEQSIEARYEDETLWLSQKLMAELFGVDVRTVSEHLKNIFASQELTAEAVIRKFRITASDGKNYQTQFYNLDAIISVGYRVNSLRATQFRQWATGVLREFAIKGYVLDRQRMENGNFLGERARRQDPENRRGRGQELLDQGRVGFIGSYRQRLSGVGRGSCSAQDSHEHGRLVQAAGRLPRI